MKELIGLFHPALVHLPIGFIIITIIYEKYGKRDSISLWIASSLSCILALTSGLILLGSGYYEGPEVFQHLVSGYVITGLCLLITITLWKKPKLFSSQIIVLKVILMLALIFGGHKGAEITHGKNYLPFLAPEKPTNPDYSSLDTIITFDMIVEPIFENKCIRCHETNDERGRLNMESSEGLLSDIYGDPAVNPGILHKSEIYKRIILDKNNKKYMPPSGIPLTFEEKQLISWWISEGASFDENIKNTSPPPYIQEILLNRHNISFKKRNFYETQIVTPLENEIINRIRSLGFNVNNIAEGNNFLEISIIGHSNSFTTERINILKEASSQITWLNLSDSDFSDDHASILKSLPNLTVLKLHNTRISSNSLSYLGELNHLNTLNIYGCNIDDSGIESILKIKNLEKLFIWNTKISQQGIETLKGTFQKLQIFNAS